MSRYECQLLALTVHMDDSEMTLDIICLPIHNMHWIHIEFKAPADFQNRRKIDRYTAHKYLFSTTLSFNSFEDEKNILTWLFSLEIKCRHGLGFRVTRRQNDHSSMIEPPSPDMFQHSKAVIL